MSKLVPTRLEIWWKRWEFCILSCSPKQGSAGHQITWDDRDINTLYITFYLKNQESDGHLKISQWGVQRFPHMARNLPFDRWCWCTYYFQHQKVNLRRRKAQHASGSGGDDAGRLLGWRGMHSRAGHGLWECLNLSFEGCFTSCYLSPCPSNTFSSVSVWDGQEILLIGRAVVWRNLQDWILFSLNISHLVLYC